MVEKTYRKYNCVYKMLDSRLEWKKMSSSAIPIINGTMILKLGQREGSRNNLKLSIEEKSIWRQNQIIEENPRPMGKCANKFWTSSG